MQLRLGIMKIACFGLSSPTLHWAGLLQRLFRISTDTTYKLVTKLNKKGFLDSIYIEFGDYVHTTFDGMRIHNHAPYAPYVNRK